MRPCKQPCLQVSLGCYRETVNLLHPENCVKIIILPVTGRHNNFFQPICQSSINPKKMEVFSISLDESKEEWSAALEQGQYKWVNVCELKGWDSQSAVDYNIYATPTMFLLDKDKTIVAKPITVAELKEALMAENLLK